MKTDFNFTKREVNKNYLIKVQGKTASGYINKLVGVSGMLELIGAERANKFVERANNCLGDVCRCKVYGGLTISFYIH